MEAEEVNNNNSLNIYEREDNTSNEKEESNSNNKIKNY